MRKNLILGLFLTSVLMMSFVSVSAQEITGEAIGGCPGLVCPGGQTASAPRCTCSGSSSELEISGGRDSTSSRTSSSSASARKSGSARYSGWDEVPAEDGGICYRKAENKGRATGRFLWKLYN